MRLILMATGPFAVPTLEGLYDSHHEVAALVTAPLRTHRGKKVPAASALREVARQHDTPILDVEHVNTDACRARLADYRADLLIVCDYGQILAPDTLATAQWGGINLHASLLPKYRGAAPINWAIYHGETETGVTVIHMTPQIDAGPCLAQARTDIQPDETAGELESRLAAMGAWLVCRAIDGIEAGRLEALPQDPALACQAPRLKKTDGLIDWGRSAAAIKHHVRAMEPWPKTYTFWHRDAGPPLRLILGPVAVVETADRGEAATADAAADAVPGTVLEAAGPRLLIAAGRGAVMPRSIQPAGRRPLEIEEFLRGYQVRAGDRLGPEELPSPPVAPMC
jgi:methionyl-tRNA formyltransferase